MGYYHHMNATSETLDSLVIENLKAALAAEKMGEKEEAAYYRKHAGELTMELLKRGWVRP